MTERSGLINLPVTVLLNVGIADRSFLLQAQGNGIQVLEPSTLRSFGICRVPIQQVIHGIVTIAQQRHGELYEADILVWSGCYVSRLSMIIDCSAASESRAEISVINSLRLGDWALCCQVSRSLTSAYVLTSHNVILHLDLPRDHAKSLRWRTSVTPSRTFLYCGTLWEREGSLVVSAGTAFGELISWQASVDSNDNLGSPTTLSFLEGHSGSVFGTSIISLPVFHGSESQIVASCSDDRTIRLWKTPAPDGGAVTRRASNAEILDEDPKLCEIWAHLSRIWSVQFVPSTKDQLRLLSFGEDGALNAWTASVQDLSKKPLFANEEALRRVYNDRYHAGKNIWSHAESSSEDSTIVCTGGADGRIVTRKVLWARHPDLNPSLIAQKFADMLVCAPGAKALKTYQLKADGNIIATSDSGHIIEGSVAGEQVCWTSRTAVQDCKALQLCLNLVQDFTFYYDSSSKNVYQISNSISSNTASIASVDGAVAWLRILSCSPSKFLQGATEVCVMLVFFDRPEVELLWIDSAPGSETGRTKVQLPETFIATSAAYDSTNCLLVCGSRAGATVTYRNVTSLVQSTDTYLCIRHVHGSDAVTDIAFLNTSRQIRSGNDVTLAHYLTTGRDGTYAIHEVAKDSLAQELSVRTVHQATTYLGSDIEGTYVVQAESGKQEILLYGFRSTEFVVWNETKNTQVFSIECGGSHRSWAFRPRQSGEAGTFVWTKAGRCCVTSYDAPDHQVLQQGGHGREIKAIAAHQESDAARLLATGAEDTDIRLFRYTYDRDGGTSLHNLHIMRKHTTGIQHLRFSRSGSMLFSSGGIEELFVWKLTKVPIVSTGSAFHAALPKDDFDSDARIMSFDITESENESVVRIAVAYSNGKAKAFDYFPHAEPRQAFIQVWQADFGAICLTQAVIFDSPATGKATFCAVFGATNGMITCLRTVQDLVAKPSRQAHQNSIASLATISQGGGSWLITGSDDSALAFTFVAYDGAFPKSPSVRIPKAHAAAVTAITTVTSIGTVTQAVSELDEDRTTAGAATRQPQRSLVITAGNDQRVKVWSLMCNAGRAQFAHNAELLKSTQIQPLGEWHTNVADVSGIEILRIQYVKLEKDSQTTAQVEVVVVGVGMESILLSFEV